MPVRPRARRHPDYMSTSRTVCYRRRPKVACSETSAGRSVSVPCRANRRAARPGSGRRPSHGLPENRPTSQPKTRLLQASPDCDLRPIRPAGPARRTDVRTVWSAAQAPERSGETRGKCPEKARSRSGHALVASSSCTGSCGLSMTTSTPESADDFDQVHLQPHARLPVPLDSTFSVRSSTSLTVEPLDRRLGLRDDHY